MPSIKIHHLRIHIKSISPQSARSLANSLGTELITRLANQQLPKGPHTISTIDAGTIQTRGTATPTDMRRQAAGLITEAITSTINSRNQEK